MRLVRIPPPVVAAVVVFVTLVVWLLASGLPTTKTPKRDKNGHMIPEAFTPDEYARFIAERPDGLQSYLFFAIDADRTADALNAVPPDERPEAAGWLTRKLINKAGGSLLKKTDDKHGPALRQLRELEPLVEYPHRPAIAAYLLYCDGKFEEAEAAFAALPSEYTAWKASGFSDLSHCRLTGFRERGKWREAYRILEPKRVVFHSLAMWMCWIAGQEAEADELVRLHREADPDDPNLPYHTAYLRFNQKRYADVIDVTADFERHPLASDAQRTILFAGADMRELRERSRVMLGRYAELEELDDQRIFIPPNHRPENVHSPWVRVAIALHHRDAAGVEKVFEMDRGIVECVHTDPHLAPLFRDAKFAELRAKYPPPK